MERVTKRRLTNRRLGTRTMSVPRPKNFLGGSELRIGSVMDCNISQGPDLRHGPSAPIGEFECQPAPPARSFSRHPALPSPLLGKGRAGEKSAIAHDNGGRLP